MAALHPPWPGFTSEGTLWFSDLTLPAVVLDGAVTVLHMPMGYAGLILPGCITAIMLSSIHLGFRASGKGAGRGVLHRGQVCCDVLNTGCCMLGVE